MPDPFGSDAHGLEDLDPGEPVQTDAPTAGLPPEPSEHGNVTPDMAGAGDGSPADDDDDLLEGEFTSFAGLSPDELAELGLGEPEAVEEGMTLEDLERWVESDPAGAIQYLAAMQAQPAVEQLHHEVQQRLAPVMQKHHQDTAKWTLDSLRAQFGADVVEHHKEALAARIQASPDVFAADPETQVQLLGDVIGRLELERQQGYNRGDDLKAAIDEVREGGDVFGRAVAAPSDARAAWGEQFAELPASVAESAGARPAPPADPRGERPSAQPRDRTTGRFVKFAGREGRYVDNGDGTFSQVVEERPGNVHIEGGSSGQPFSHQPPVDPLLAEIDAIGARRDPFGRISGF